ncbi:hypothetical protein [uncultured Gimesia sp.]|uniref:hypothetical protein n=1 Tax=uncultured Gimesia sp. TaxID=1678688 RepID=UPI00262F52B7|nr:hypothetical protein [uncultured Gimesia sp.]
MYLKSTAMLFIAISLFYNCELMAENPIGINTYLGKWAFVSDPSKPTYIIKNVEGQLVIESLVKGEVVSSLKHNTHSLSFLTTSSKVNPLTGTPDSLNVILIPDVRSNANMFHVYFSESAELQLTADTKIIDLMSRVKNGNNQIKGKTGISNEQSKRALENIYTKPWDFSELQCADAADKVTVQIVAMKNDVQAIFTHGSNKAQVPAKIVDNTVTISIDSKEYDDLKKIPIFLSGRKYHFQLIPLCGNKDHLIFKMWYTEGNRLISAYLMAPSICK